MKANIIVGLAVAGLLALAPLAVQAEVLTIVPVKAVVCPADESGVTKVALQFDFSGIRSGEGRQIDQALLEWRVTGMASDAYTEYVLIPVAAAWSEAGVAGGSAPAMAEVASDTWGFSLLDYERNQGGLLRFDILHLVHDWLSGEATNHGVIIATEDLGREGLSNQLDRIRLTVRYGFVE